jgi:membrane AbrB-like protein
MVLSGIGHYLGLVIGRPPSSFIFMGFAITGSLVGARFSSIPLRDLKKLLLASFSVFVVSGLLALVFAVPVAKILNLPYGQVFVAYAPGGVEAMAAMAIALGYDPAFVATHHLFRIFLLFLFLPASLRIVKKIRRRQWVS